jgi:hypothetical protein
LILSGGELSGGSHHSDFVEQTDERRRNNRIETEEENENKDFQMGSGTCGYGDSAGGPCRAVVCVIREGAGDDIGQNQPLD